MKKLFGLEKPPKAAKPPYGQPTTEASASVENLSTPIYQRHASSVNAQRPEAIARPSHDKTRALRSSESADRWSMVSVPVNDESPNLPNPHPPPLSASRSTSLASLPPGASVPTSSPLVPRPASPFSAPIPSNGHEPAMLKKKQHPPPPTAGGVAALGILRALDPHPPANDHDSHLVLPQEVIRRDDRSISSKDERREKKGFWERAINAPVKDKEREKTSKDYDVARKDRDSSRKDHHQQSHFPTKDTKEREEDSQAELTRMIGYLTATASEDWALVLEVCERASATEGNAKEAVRALRREFKYGEPPAQLAAARLWAIMLRNSSDTFIVQSTARKFLETVEDLLQSSRTSPVVKERLLDVIAAAAYASSQSKDGKGEREGFRGLWRRVKPADKPIEGIPFDSNDSMFNPATASNQRADPVDVRHNHIKPDDRDLPAVPDKPKKPRKRKSGTRNRIIPLDEDMRRLTQECKIGSGNASLLLEALRFAKPQDLKRKDVIMEFYPKCKASQELIFAQIPWASAGAERSRLERIARVQSGEEEITSEQMEQTPEETLLANLLASNEELVEALRVYEDLERVAIERETEDRSRKETRLDRRAVAALDDSNDRKYTSSSRRASPSPPTSPPVSPNHHHTNYHATHHPHTEDAHSVMLAPPPQPPMGPRSPTVASSVRSTHSRSPSPPLTYADKHSGSNSSGSLPPKSSFTTSPDYSHFISEPESYTPTNPSAKALGKRKIIMEEEPANSLQNDGVDFEHLDDFPEDGSVSDGQNGIRKPWEHSVHYVYDAAAERTLQRIRDGELTVH